MLRFIDRAQALVAKPTLLTGASVVDQCLFTGTNFLTAVMVGRLGSVDQLGLYTLIISLVMITIASYRSVLISPYVVLRNRLQEERQAIARAALLAATGSMAAVILCVGFMFAMLVGDVTVLIAGVAVASGLARDFMRRLSIAELRPHIAMPIDAAIGLLQLGGLLVAAYSGWFVITATNVLLYASIVWVVVGGLGICLQRRLFVAEPGGRWQALRDLWPNSRWIGLSHVLTTTQSFVVPWMLALWTSLETAGAYAACWMLVQVVSPVVEGVGSLLGPLFSREVAHGNLRGLRRQIWIASRNYIGLMLMVVTAVALVGDDMLRLCFGHEYQKYERILIVLVGASFFHTVGIPAGKALTQLDRAAWNFLITLVSLASLMPLTVWWLGADGVLGGARALAIVHFASSLSRWILLRVRLQSWAVSSTADPNPASDRFDALETSR